MKHIRLHLIIDCDSGDFHDDHTGEVARVLRRFADDFDGGKLFVARETVKGDTLTITIEVPEYKTGG